MSFYRGLFVQGVGRAVSVNLFGMLLRYVCVFYGIYFPSSEVVGHCVLYGFGLLLAQ